MLSSYLLVFVSVYEWRRLVCDQQSYILLCAVPLKLSGLRHVNLDVYNNNNNNNILVTVDHYITAIDD